MPKNYYSSVKSWWGDWSAPSLDYPVDLELVRKYYHITDNPAEADFALVFVSSPYQNNDGGSYDSYDRETGGNGYIPITLQYQTYTATEARAQSIAAGDPVIDPAVTNRSYKDKTATPSNTMDLATILTTRNQMGDKPVIVVTNITRPMVFHEFEHRVDAIVVRFGIGEQAVLDIIAGKYEPSGLLPVQMPANMETVERQ
ncbi:MAG: glycoside hydrolase family 3 C-terminal domain-containing protein [Tannerellaceae bacterium]|nr:glycoside hydrolase family 3 C-terminal domain-containing protein [Tannerellaceae bacterium]